MKKITQKQIANFVGVSAVFIHEIRRSRKRFGRDKIESLSELTGIPVKLFFTKKGEDLYQLLVMAYEDKQGGLK